MTFLASPCQTVCHCNTLQRYCNTPQDAAMHCNTLQHTATRCKRRCNTVTCRAPLSIRAFDVFILISTLQHAATHCNTLQHTATYCNTLQHTATHCNTLQHTATRCNTMQDTAAHCNTLQHTATQCNTIQHNATHGNTRHHTATHCNTRQHAATYGYLGRLPLCTRDSDSEILMQPMFAVNGTKRSATTHCVLQYRCSSLHTATILQHTRARENGTKRDNTLQHTAKDAATYCHTLPHTATHCNKLQCTATRCNTLQHTATHCNTLENTATHCNTLQHTATHFNPLQHAATHCNTLIWTEYPLLLELPTQKFSWARFFALNESKRCNTLQHTATHCNTLQRLVMGRVPFSTGASDAEILMGPIPCSRRNKARIRQSLSTWWAATALV